MLRRLGHGQRVPLEQAPCPPGQPLAQVRDENGVLAGIIRCLAGDDDLPIAEAAPIWKAEKWLG